MSAQITINARAGTTQHIDFTISDVRGDPLDWSTSTVRFEIAPQPGAGPSLTYEIATVTPGSLRVEIPADDMRTLVGWGGRYHWVLLHVAGAVITELAHGLLRVAGELAPSGGP